MKACRQQGRFCGHFARFFPAVFESLQAAIVSEALFALLSPSGKIPFPAGRLRAAGASGGGAWAVVEVHVPLLEPQPAGVLGDLAAAIALDLSRAKVGEYLVQHRPIVGLGSSRRLRLALDLDTAIRLDVLLGQR
jgi:hypothetical protein